MAETLLQVIREVARPCMLDPTLTTLSETDGSLTLGQYVIQALRYLERALDDEAAVFQAEATLNFSAGTRSIALPNDAEGQGVYHYSVRNITENALLQPSTRSYITQTYSDFASAQGKPELWYLEGLNQIALYPLPNVATTVTLQYQRIQSAVLDPETSLSTVVQYPELWLDFIKKYAQYLWEVSKGFGNHNATLNLAMELLYQIKIRAWRNNPSFFTGPF